MANEVILEGEAIGFDPKTDQYLPFQETVQRKRKYDIEEKVKEIPLRLFCFELLYKDGESYIDRPFIERRGELVKSVLSKQGSNRTIVVTDQKKVVEDRVLDELFDKAVNDGLEGIMAKRSKGFISLGQGNGTGLSIKRVIRRR